MTAIQYVHHIFWKLLIGIIAFFIFNFREEVALIVNIW